MKNENLNPELYKVLPYEADIEPRALEVGYYKIETIEGYLKPYLISKGKIVGRLVDYDSMLYNPMVKKDPTTDPESTLLDQEDPNSIEIYWYVLLIALLVMAWTYFKS